MKHLIILASSLLVCYAGFTQVKEKFHDKTAKERISNVQVVKTVDAVKSDKVVKAVEASRIEESVKKERAYDNRRAIDTIPKHMYKYFTVDNGRYLHYLHTNLNDSVKSVKASAKDWDDFNAAYNKLSQTLKNNPFNHVADYISPNKDYKSIELIDNKFQTNTAKVCLRQLIFNIKLSDLLLNKPLADKTDLQLLSMSITNIDTLCLAYIVPYVGHNKVMALMRKPKIIFKVFDKTGAELKNANCYLVSPYVCRSLACLSCKNIAAPCEPQTVDKIIGQKDYLFDCANPSVLEIAPGPYHIFIVNNGTIVSYKSWSTDASDFTADFQPKTINLRVQ